MHAREKVGAPLQLELHSLFTSHLVSPFHAAEIVVFENISFEKPSGNPQNEANPVLSQYETHIKKNVY